MHLFDITEKAIIQCVPPGRRQVTHLARIRIGIASRRLASYAVWIRHGIGQFRIDCRMPDVGAHGFSHVLCKLVRVQ